MKSYIIPTVEQKLDNIILHTKTNDLKNIDILEETAAEILMLAMFSKMDINGVLLYLAFCYNIYDYSSI